MGHDKLQLGAIANALKNAYTFTYGADKINIFTDHASLVGLAKKCLDNIPKTMAHYSYHIRHINGEDNIPADMMSRLHHDTTEMPDVDHYAPVKHIEEKAVQTRSHMGAIKVAKDLIDMAERAKEDEDYKELIERVT